MGYLISSKPDLLVKVTPEANMHATFAGVAVIDHSYINQ